MPLPINERAFRAVLDRLRHITLANGYNTDAGASAFRSRRNIDSAELPAVVLWDDSETTNQGTANHSSMLIRQRMLVIGFVSKEGDPGEQVGLLKADIKRALLRERGYLSDDDGKLGEIEYTGTTTEPPPTGGSTEYTQVQCVVSYKERRGDPTSSSAP